MMIVRCPVCRREVCLSPVRHKIANHKGRRVGQGRWCPGSGREIEVKKGRE